MLSVSWLLIAVPLASFFFLLLAGRRADAWGHWVGVAASSVAAIVGLGAFFQLLGRDSAERFEAIRLYSWISGGELSVDFGLLLDPLSITFVLLITIVGTLIHIYSVAYMENDPRRRLFF